MLSTCGNIVIGMKPTIRELANCVSRVTSQQDVVKKIQSMWATPAHCVRNVATLGHLVISTTTTAVSMLFR